MPRVKRGTTHVQKRKALLKQAKGFMWRRKSTIKLGRPAVLKAGVNAYVGRKNKKRDNRSLWLVQINAACRLNETTYSKLIAALKANKIELDRKVLAEIAGKYPKVFAAIVSSVKK